MSDRSTLADRLKEIKARLEPPHSVDAKQAAWREHCLRVVLRGTGAEDDLDITIAAAREAGREEGLLEERERIRAALDR